MVRLYMGQRRVPRSARDVETAQGQRPKICVWINPYIAQKSPLFEEGMEHGYLVKTPDGDVWQWDKWQAGMGLVDFTNPGAVNGIKTSSEHSSIWA